jgi:hypothetical protein
LIGSDRDNEQFRKQIQLKIEAASGTLMKFGTDLKEFRDLQVRYNEQKARNEQAEMFTRNWVEWKDKFSKSVEEIRKREKLYIEILKRRRDTAKGNDMEGAPSQQ